MSDDAGKEFDVETPMGKIRTKGYHLGNVLQIVAAVLLGLMVMMMYELRAEMKSQAPAAMAASKLEHDKLGTAIEKLTDSQSEMNYILTLTPDERAKLNLRMPDSLRRKLIDR